MSEAMFHAKCLRAIGQDLEIKRVAQFRLKSSDEGYLLSLPLRVTKGTAATVAEGDDETSQKVSSREPMEFLYTLDAIERLDEMGRTKRRMGNGMPDFFSLSQCLRALGTVIDSKRGQLMQIDRQAQLNATPSFSIQYQTSTGECVREDHTLPNLYDCSVHLYKARRPDMLEDHSEETRPRIMT
jgi:hypothetical protein